MNTILEEKTIDKKTVSISKKRQFTIPTKYYKALGFNDKAVCMIRGNELVIRPVKPIIGDEFAEQILADLISQGYQGNELLKEFKKEQAKVKKAIDSILNEAKSVAEGKTDYSTYDDVFNSED